MRVCHITTTHLPDDSRVFHKELKSLARRYDDVTMVCGFRGRIPEDKGGVKFVTYEQHRNAMPAYIATGPEEIGVKLHNMRLLFRSALDVGADLYHCHEFESMLVAMMLKRRLGCKIIYDSHEMHASSFAMRMPASIRATAQALIQAYEKHCIRQFDFGIGATWRIRDYLAGVLGTTRTDAILNVPRTDLFRPAERDWEGQLTVCHEGSLNFGRGLKTMVQAIALVAQKHPVKFRIVGTLPAPERRWLDQFVSDNHLERTVEVTGWLDFTRVPDEVARCHVGLIAMQPLPNHVDAMPNKIFNYMCCGLALIVPDFQVPSRRIVDEERCGLYAQANSAESYADSVNYLIEHRGEARQMGKRSAQAAKSKYNWDLAEQKLYAIYERLLR